MFLLRSVSRRRRPCHRPCCTNNNNNGAIEEGVLSTAAVAVTTTPIATPSGTPTNTSIARLSSLTRTTTTTRTTRTTTTKTATTTKTRRNKKSNLLGTYPFTITPIGSKVAAVAATSLLVLSSSYPFSSCLAGNTSVNSIFASAFSTTTVNMPNPPYLYRASALKDDNNADGNNMVESSLSPSSLFELNELGEQVYQSEHKRHEAYEVSRKIHIELVKVRNSMEMQTLSMDEISSSLQSIEEMLLQAIGGGSDNNKNESSSTDATKPTMIADRHPREANLSMRVEEYIRLKAFHYFLQTGQLLPPTTTSTTDNSSKFLSYVTDEEYLGGACMGVCHDLARYGMGRATARDVHSVSAARDVVQELLDYLLQFDFRNGYLRRKYDGIKYALKTLETILYELSVTGTTLEGEEEGTDKGKQDDDDDGNEPDNKRTRVEGGNKKGLLVLPKEELEAIRLRMEHRDELREKLIKKCRDGQKSAKQAIYALHRGDMKKADKLLYQCEQCIGNDLLPIVIEEPPLRSGSYANVLEEYVEAKLFRTWLLGKQDDDVDGNEKKAATADDDKAPSTEGKACGSILRPNDFFPTTVGLQLQPEEYLGGLCDLTGEVGRYAVQCGTVRDHTTVRQCLITNTSILVAIETMARTPYNMNNKKIDPLRRSIEKIERMIYELSLSEAAGGIKVDTSTGEDTTMQGIETSTNTF